MLNLTDPSPSDPALVITQSTGERLIVVFRDDQIVLRIERDQPKDQHKDQPISAMTIGMAGDRGSRVYTQRTHLCAFCDSRHTAIRQHEPLPEQSGVCRPRNRRCGKGCLTRPRKGVFAKIDTRGNAPSRRLDAPQRQYTQQPAATARPAPEATAMTVSPRETRLSATAV